MRTRHVRGAEALSVSALLLTLSFVFQYDLPQQTSELIEKSSN